MAGKARVLTSASVLGSGWLGPVYDETANEG